MTRLWRFTGMTAVTALALSACQTLAASQTATVNLRDPATASAVQVALAKAMNRAYVALSVADGDTSTITVLPPPLGPYEDRSTALPVHFDIVIDNGKCLAVRQDTGQAYPLRGVKCTPAGGATSG